MSTLEIRRPLAEQKLKRKNDGRFLPALTANSKPICLCQHRSFIAFLLVAHFSATSSKYDITRGALSPRMALGVGRWCLRCGVDGQIVCDSFSAFFRIRCCRCCMHFIQHRVGFNYHCNWYIQLCIWAPTTLANCTHRICIAVDGLPMFASQSHIKF